MIISLKKKPILSNHPTVVMMTIGQICLDTRSILSLSGII